MVWVDVPLPDLEIGKLYYIRAVYSLAKPQ